MKKSTTKKDLPFIDLGVLEMKGVVPRSAEDSPIVYEDYDNSVPCGLYKMYKDVETPKYQTKKSACFDLSAYFGKDIVCVETYNRLLMHAFKTISKLPERDNLRGIHIEPGECAFIPTGLIFDIPKDFKLAIYPRSGISGKKHLKLANCIATIDEDYIEQTMLLIFNNSEMRQSIAHGDRLAQGEIVSIYRAQFDIISEPPQKKSDRDGGMGSTGIQTK